MSWWCGASQKMLSYSVFSFFSSKAVLLSLHLVWFDRSVELDILNRGHFGQKRLKYLPFGLCGESLWPLILNKILIFFLLLWQIPWPIAICGEKKKRFPFLYMFLHWLQSMTERNLGRSCGRMPFTGLPFGLCLTIFLVQPRSICWGMVQPPVDWALLYHLTTRKMPHRNGCRSIWPR